MTQKLYGKQGPSTTVDTDNNTYLQARNRFEETLEALDVRIAEDEETMEKFVVFGMIFRLKIVTIRLFRWSDES